MNIPGWLWCGLIDVICQIALTLVLIVFGLQPREGRLEIDLPRSDAPAFEQESPGAGFQTIWIDVLDDQRCLHLGLELDPASLAAVLTEAASNRLPVVVRGSRPTAYGAVFRVIDQARSAGVEHLSLAFMPEQP